MLPHALHVVLEYINTPQMFRVKGQLMLLQKWLSRLSEFSMYIHVGQNMHTDWLYRAPVQCQCRLLMLYIQFSVITLFSTQFKITHLSFLQWLWRKDGELTVQPIQLDPSLFLVRQTYYCFFFISLPSLHYSSLFLHFMTVHVCMYVCLSSHAVPEGDSVLEHQEKLQRLTDIISFLEN